MAVVPEGLGGTHSCHPALNSLAMFPVLVNVVCRKQSVSMLGICACPWLSQLSILLALLTRPPVKSPGACSLALSIQV